MLERVGTHLSKVVKELGLVGLEKGLKLLAEGQYT